MNTQTNWAPSSIGSERLQKRRKPTSRYHRTGRGSGMIATRECQPACPSGCADGLVRSIASFKERRTGKDLTGFILRTGQVLTKVARFFARSSNLPGARAGNRTGDARLVPTSVTATFQRTQNYSNLRIAPPEGTVFDISRGIQVN